MDWLIPLLFVIVSIALSSSSGKKKKQEAEAKRAQQARQAGQGQQMRQDGSRPQPKAAHPYAESAKDKGMTLDDFRRKYESMNGGKRPQSAAKPAAAKTQTAKPANAESAPKRQTVRPPQASPGQMNGAGSVQKAPNASNVPNAAEQRPKQQKAAAKQPPQKKSVPVRSVDIGSQAKESPVIAGVMAHKNDLHTEFGADAVAFVQGKNLSPMQQGLLWAEILGPPKAKQRRGGRY